MTGRAGGGEGPYFGLTGRHLATFLAVFQKPTRANIAWQSIESLFAALGGLVEEGAGSRVRVRLGDRVAVFHRPHPQKETKKYAVEAVRDFLTSAGFMP